MFSFTNIIAWQKAHLFTIHVYATTNKFPDSERYNIVSQFQRAAISIGANIAEGYGKLSKKDKLRFFNIAQGSLAECENYILISHSLKFINDDEFNKLSVLALDIEKLLNAYSNGIVKNIAISEKEE